MEARPAGNPEKAGITDVHTLKFLMNLFNKKSRNSQRKFLDNF